MQVLVDIAALKSLIDAVDALLGSEDSTGCTGGLTVISGPALADVTQAATQAARGYVEQARLDRLEDHAANFLGED